MYTRLLSVSALAAGALAQTLTGATQCESAGVYQLCQNLWGTSAATSGSQTSNLVSASGNSVSWSTTWTWAGGPNSVKSYANVQSSTAKGMTLASISSAPTSWSWNYASVSSDVRADVSYDIWLGTSPGGAPASSASSYEIMIWLSGRGGIQPVGSQAQTGINIGGHTWTLWSGPNSNWHVYSFVSASGDITSYSGDLNAFFQWLEANEGVSNSLYLQAVQTGTEPFEGSAQLVTSSYSVSVTTGGGGGGTTTAPHSTTTTSSTSPSGCTAAHYAQCGGTGFTGCTTCASGYTCKVSSQYYAQCL